MCRSPEIVRHLLNAGAKIYHEHNPYEYLQQEDEYDEEEYENVHIFPYTVLGRLTIPGNDITYVMDLMKDHRAIPVDLERVWNEYQVNSNVD
jgi:hypothetical protein